MSESTDRAPFQLSEAVSILSSTPATLRGLLGRLSDDWLDFQEDPQAWSPRMVLLHFIHNERTNWIPRARVILEEGDHKFPPFQQLPDDVPSSAPVAELLAQFAGLRQANLSALAGFHLQPGDYERRGEHPSFGTVTLGQLLATWVVHDLNHLDQIVKTLSKRYGQEVGPWRVNLAILER